MRAMSSVSRESTESGFYLLNGIIFVLKMYLKLFFIVHILFFMHRAGVVLILYYNKAFGAPGHRFG